VRIIKIGRIVTSSGLSYKFIELNLSLKVKIIQPFKKCVFNKNANCFSLTKVIISGLIITFCSIVSINAQVEGDQYSQQGEDLTKISSLMIAVSNNDLEGVKFFSRAGGSSINQKNIGGATALHIAARNGNLEIVTLLLASNADTNIADNEGWVPLMRAATAGNAKIIESLIEKGAKVSLLNLNRESVLTHAALSDCADCLDIIFNKSDLIKTMDTELLKEQLANAFIISRNRENKLTQNLLEKYLDRVTKITPIDSDSSASNSYDRNQFSSQSSKIKYILVGDDSEAGARTGDENKIFVPAHVAAESLKTTMPIEQSLLPIDAEQKTTTRFKFVSGAQGASVTNSAPSAAIDDNEDDTSKTSIPTTDERIYYKFDSGKKPAIE